ncbi:hypothetical protein [Trueperella pyogenes]|uniref:hypothetical protein n=1 Tax=Trueperella pyogenes TaxID=1661 RepID=UPI00345DB2BC
MVKAVGVSELQTMYAPFFPMLTIEGQIPVKSGRDGGEPALEIDGFLMSTFVEGVDVPDELLDVTEASVRGGWDPDLTEHTLMWIAKHRARNRAVIPSV